MNKTIITMLLILLITGSAFAQGEIESGPVRIGILPDVDSLPIQLAQRDGLYTSEGSAVELIAFRSPVERDAAFQAGELDGMVGDTLGAFFLREAGYDILITSITNGRYGIAANPFDGATQLSDLEGRQIAVSRNTIIEYVADSLMGETPSDMMAIPKIPVRMEMLINGSIAGACLPEPLYSIAVSNGAVPLADSTQLQEVPGVMIFTREAVSERREDLTAFYRAYSEAAEKINSNPEAYRDYLVEAAGVPDTLKGDFAFVTYERPRLPERQGVEEVYTWLKERDLISSQITYSDLTDASVVDSL